MLSEEKNFFKRLNEINVNEHTETKNGLTYLSWMWAWQTLKLLYPESYSTVYKPENGNNYWTDGRTCWVETGVTLVYYNDEGERCEIENREMLPVMDFKNRSIPADSVTSMDVNKAIQRSITKAIARHGLGAYIYAGEDMPEESEETKAARLEAEQRNRQDIARLCAEIDAALKESAQDMSAEQKRAFVASTIVPIIGQANYKACKDKVKLQALLDSLKRE